MIYIGDIVEWEGEECIVTNVNRTYVEIYTGNNQIVSVPKKKKLTVVSPMTDDWLQMECEKVWFDTRYCVSETIFYLLKSCQDAVIKQDIASDNFCLNAKLQMYFEKHPVSNTKGLRRHIDLLKQHLTRYYQDIYAPL